VAVDLANRIAEMGPFELLSDGRSLPVFAWTLKEPTHWSLYDLADRLRDRGWQVPAYRMPGNRQDMVVQRVVVRNGFTHDLADMLLRDIRRHLDWFATQPGLKATVSGAGFHH
jgi:glutamate decarboxylase